LSVRGVARFVSIVGHPFVLVPLAIVIATRAPNARAGPVLAAVGFTMFVLAVVVVRAWRRGEIADVDVSTREHRPRVFIVGIAASALACVAMIATHQNAATIRGCAIACATLVVMALLNRFALKASLHSAFAMMAAGICWRASATIGIAFALAALAVAASRVVYGRHTTPEVLSGLAVGVLSAAAFAVV
jgi:hypothetical protein